MSDSENVETLNLNIYVENIYVNRVKNIFLLLVI